MPQSWVENPEHGALLFLVHLPGVGAGHTLGVDIVTQLLSTVVYPSPDVNLEEQHIFWLICLFTDHYNLVGAKETLLARHKQGSKRQQKPNKPQVLKTSVSSVSQIIWNISNSPGFHNWCLMTRNITLHEGKDMVRCFEITFKG